MCHTVRIHGPIFVQLYVLHIPLTPTAFTAIRMAGHQWRVARRGLLNLFNLLAIITTFTKRCNDWVIGKIDHALVCIPWAVLPEPVYSLAVLPRV